MLSPMLCKDIYHNHVILNYIIITVVLVPTTRISMTYGLTHLQKKSQPLALDAFGMCANMRPQTLANESRPMGMNGSHFLTTEENKDLVVVSSVGPEVAVRLRFVSSRGNII